jgi:acyl carrier protein
MKYFDELTALIAPYNHRKQEIQADTTFASLGMDSYEVVDFLVQVEKQFNVFIDDDAMLEMKSLQDVFDTLDKSSQEEN